MHNESNLMTTSAEFSAREKRFNDAASLKKPDRIPLAFVAHYYPARMAGISYKQAISDHAMGFSAFRDFTRKLDLDMAPTPYTLIPAQPCAELGLIQYKVPGYGLADNLPHQYVEKEYLQAEEYDAFLDNPDNFTVRKIWPRIARTLEPLAEFPPAHMILDARALILGGGGLVGTPAYQALLKALLRLGEEVNAYKDAEKQYTAEMKKLGFPILTMAGARAPFDFLSDFLRGLKGSTLDMYLRPEKLLKAVELLTPVCYQAGLNNAKAAGNPRVFVTLHRGAGGFMSDEQFAKFYWPSLKKVLLILVDAGLTPIVFFEGDYTPRLEYLAELPKGKIVGHFDVIDRKKARKIIGNNMCFWGNVSAQTLIMGNPDKVRDDVMDLIDTFGDTGGLIIDGTVGIPDEAKPENVEAMVNTVFKHGTY
jgi:uroporphyrinogen-III decarboxylase